MQNFATVPQKFRTLHVVALPVLSSGFLLMSGRSKETIMKIALAIAFAVIAIAPFFGRWRANVWLKKHMPERGVAKGKRVPEAA